MILGTFVASVLAFVASIALLPFIGIVLAIMVVGGYLNSRNRTFLAPFSLVILLAAVCLYLYAAFQIHWYWLLGGLAVYLFIGFVPFTYWKLGNNTGKILDFLYDLPDELFTLVKAHDERTKILDEENVQRSKKTMSSLRYQEDSEFLKIESALTTILESLSKKAKELCKSADMTRQINYYFFEKHVGAINLARDGKDSCIEKLSPDPVKHKGTIVYWAMTWALYIVQELTVGLIDNIFDALSGWYRSIVSDQKAKYASRSTTVAKP